MIYFVDQELFPKVQSETQEGIEFATHQDLNDFDWLFGRVLNGFFIKYCGDEHFVSDTMSVMVEEKVLYLLKNTRCIFVANEEFDTYATIREVILTNWTDDIWDFIKQLFEVRFEHEEGLLKSEITD